LPAPQLAAALRAAREWSSGKRATPPNKDTEPSPVLSADGILAYYRVREAIESWDAAFGYELVDNDWKLEFPPSNPLLAEIEHQAVEQSRTRQQMLVAAAPRAYGSRHVAAGGGFDEEEEFEGDDGEFSDEGGGGNGDGYGSGGGDGTGGGFGDGDGHGGHGHGDGDGVGGPYAVDANENGVNGEFFGDGAPQGSGGRQGENDGSSKRSGSGGEVRNGVVGVPGAGPDTTADGGGGAAGGAAASAPAGVAGAAGSASGGMPQNSGQQPGSSINVVAGTPIDNATNPAQCTLPPSHAGGSPPTVSVRRITGNRTASSRAVSMRPAPRRVLPPANRPSACRSTCR
jgi:hypothetical protein